MLPQNLAIIRAMRSEVVLSSLAASSSFRTTSMFRCVSCSTDPVPLLYFVTLLVEIVMLVNSKEAYPQLIVFTSSSLPIS
jgi:hypothetical protein